MRPRLQLAAACLLTLGIWITSLIIDLDYYRPFRSIHRLFLFHTPVAAPFRPFLLIIAGLWLWIANVLILYYVSWRTDCDLLRPILVDDDEESLASPPIRLESEMMLPLKATTTTTAAAGQSSRTLEFIQNQNYTQNARNLFAIAVGFSATLGIIFVLYETELVSAWAGLWLTTVCSISLLANPVNVFRRTDRYSFLRALKRIIFGGISKIKIQFTDVLLADLLTSYARVLSELWTVLMLVSRNPSTALSHQQQWNSSKYRAQRQLYSQSWQASLLFTLPYFWRFCQCVAEYRFNPALNRLQFYNALKYASILPVVVCNFIIFQQSSSILWTASIIFSLINSTFSLYWDLVHDWGLFANAFGLRDTLVYRIPFMTAYCGGQDQLHTEETDSDSNLRSVRRRNLSPLTARLNLPITYHKRPLPWSVRLFYYVAILFNCIARYSWAMRLYLHSVHMISDQELSLFTVQLVELTRRWLWIFIRVERQWLVVDFHRKRQQFE